MNTICPRFPKMLFICLSTILLCSFLGGNAVAILYDDFEDGVLDKWQVNSTVPGLVSEHDGKLYFDGSTPDRARLDATASLGGNTLLELEFYNFSSTNTSPSGQGLSAALQLFLGPSTDSVVIMLTQNVGGYFLEFDRILDSVRVQQWNIPTNITTGKLGLYYDGTFVYARYSDEVGPDAPWYTFGGAASPGWTQSVGLNISGITGGSGRTSFQVDNVAYKSVPEPFSLLLLGLGLVGLAGVRRTFKK